MTSHLNEELNKKTEKFSLFVKVCRKFLKRLKNIYALVLKVETQNIKSIMENKEKIYDEFNLILENFDNIINDPNILTDFRNNNETNSNLYNILETNDNDSLTKLFNFIDIIGKLELNNKKLLDKNDLINQKLKIDVYFLS